MAFRADRRRLLLVLRGTTCDIILIYIQDPSRPGLRGPFEVQGRSLVYVGQGDLVWFLCGTYDDLDILLANGEKFSSEDPVCIPDTRILVR